MRLVGLFHIVDTGVVYAFVYFMPLPSVCCLVCVRRVPFRLSFCDIRNRGNLNQSHV